MLLISGLGLVLLNSGNIDAAIDTYDGLIGNRPNTLAAYFMRGVAYSRKGLKVILQYNFIMIFSITCFCLK
jgi:tetratricopeptide (TPR) repeat protein